MVDVSGAGKQERKREEREMRERERERERETSDDFATNCFFFNSHASSNCEAVSFKSILYLCNCKM